MKNVKFRGKNINNKWFFGGITLGKKYIVDRFTFHGIRPETAGQFTGCLDENDTEIYEGDIIELENNAPYIVEWDEEKHGFVIKNDSERFPINDDLYCRVAGNIHDEPSLFKLLQHRFVNKLD